MSKSVGDLKLVIMSENEFLPHFSDRTWYYLECSEDVDDLMLTLEEVSEHYAEVTYYDEEDEECDEEYTEFLELKETLPPVELLKKACCHNGENGFECACYAEGKDIVDALATFLEENFYNGWVFDDLDEKHMKSYHDEHCDDEDFDEDAFRKMQDESSPTKIRFDNLIQDARNNPDSCEKLSSLIDAVKEIIDINNGTNF